MEKKKLINAVFWILIIAVLIACVYIIMLLRAETSQCLQNAFTYGAEHQIEGDVMCSCTEIKDNGIRANFYFNETDWWSVPTENPIFQYTP